MKIAGYASMYNNIDSHGDVVRRGAFNEQIAEIGGAGLPICFEHSFEKLCGSSLKLIDRRKGLWVEAKLFDTDIADKIGRYLDNGISIGLSIGYRVSKAVTFGPSSKVSAINFSVTPCKQNVALEREIIAARLIEISLTLTPSNPLTLVKRVARK